MIPGESRRSILRKMTLGTLVAGPISWLDGCATRTAGQSAHPVYRPDSIDSSLTSPRKTTTGPTHALSLTALAAAVQHERTRSNSGEAPCVPKITRFSGFLTDERGDVILFGIADPTVPEIELDCLVVALRNAYQVTGEYQGVPGCTIDPRPGLDPWIIQQVRVFGMPFDCSIAQRQVFLDYELKQIGAGVVKQAGVHGVFEFASETDACSVNSQTNRSAVHRYWFYPRIPASPRFERNDGIMRILAPTSVQLLTEQEFLDRQGQRIGATNASGEALAFAKDVSMILAEERVRRYARLTADFRLVELAKLIHFEKISAENLGYYLEDHPLDKMATPQYVGGIIRSENGEVICDATVVEKMGQIQCKQRTVSYRTEYRGGVEVRIDVAQEDFRPRPSQALSTMRGGILASRPSPGAVIWPVPAALRSMEI